MQLTSGSSQLQGGSLQGGGSLCCPLWSHLLITKSKPHTRAVPMPTSASSIGPVTYEHEIKRVAVMLATSGALLLRRTASLVQLCPPLVAQVAPAVALVAFSIWGLGPTTRSLRKNVFKVIPSLQGNPEFVCSFLAAFAVSSWLKVFCCEYLCWSS